MRKDEAEKMFRYEFDDAETGRRQGGQRARGPPRSKASCMCLLFFSIALGLVAAIMLGYGLIRLLFGYPELVSVLLLGVGFLLAIVATVLNLTAGYNLTGQFCSCTPVWEL